VGLLRRLFGGGGEVPEWPSSGNRSSALHLWWHGVDAGAAPLVAAGATLEVLQRPSVERLYFWALQASFVDGRGTRHGAAHLGLQWNPNHPGNGAVNWGGYADTGDVGSVLAGSTSTLPSTPDDPNTRDYGWRESVAYRLRIERSSAGWRGKIIDLMSGDDVVVRDLYVGGDRLANLVVWSEVFASCNDPTVVVRWSGFEGYGADGSIIRPRSVGLTFPPDGCPNTDTVADDVGFLQVTSTTRRAHDGDSLAVPRVG